MKVLDINITSIKRSFIFKLCVIVVIIISLTGCSTYTVDNIIESNLHKFAEKVSFNGGSTNDMWLEFQTELASELDILSDDIVLSNIEPFYPAERGTLINIEILIKNKSYQVKGLTERILLD